MRFSGVEMTAQESLAEAEVSADQPAKDVVRIVQVQTDELEGLWPSVLPWLEGLIEEVSLARMTPDDWKKRIEENEAQLFVVWADLERKPLAVFVTQMDDYPRARVLSIPLLAGRERKRWEHLLHDVEAWARRSGCTQVEIPGRPGWGRIYPEYEARHVVFVKEL